MIRGVIFDMDGLMFDTERLSTEGWLKAAEELHYPLTVPFIKSFKGTSTGTSRRMFLEAFGDAVDYDAARTIRTNYVNGWMKEHGVPIKKGLITLLEYLQAHQIPAAVATSTRKELAQMHLEDAGVCSYFQAFVYGSEVPNGKPNPDIFLIAANKIGVAPSDCLVLEDSPAGITAGKAAGASVIAIPDQIELSEELLKGVTVLPDLEKVCAWIDQKNHG
jgi:HAD superfamily hydrolase (TIGR01509 family)